MLVVIVRFAAGVQVTTRDLVAGGQAAVVFGQSAQYGVSRGYGGDVTQSARPATLSKTTASTRSRETPNSCSTASMRRSAAEGVDPEQGQRRRRHGLGQRRISPYGRLRDQHRQPLADRVVRHVPVLPSIAPSIVAFAGSAIRANTSP